MSVNLAEALSHLRAEVQEALNSYRYHHASFLVDKILSISDFAPEDVFLQAKIYFHSQQHRRCTHTLKRNRLVKHKYPGQNSGLLSDRGNIQYVCLAAKCLLDLNEWQECLDLLAYQKSCVSNLAIFNDDGAGEYTAQVYFMRGKCMERLDIKVGAVQCYCTALRLDPSHTEAFDSLVDSHLMEPGPQSEFIRTLSFKPEHAYIRSFYLCKLNTISLNVEDSGQNEIIVLERDFKQKNSLQLKLIYALRAFNAYILKNAYKITRQIVHYDDPYYDECLLLHIAVLVELKEKTQLYSLANRLVELRPGSYLSWFCVGSYYYAIENYEKAGKYFGKATSMNMRFVEGWKAYGHTFSNMEESDQALSAYRNVMRLHPASPSGQLYMGMEFMRGGNSLLASEFIGKSVELGLCDPFVYNEMGVVMYKLKRYAEAKRFLWRAVQLCPSGLDSSEHWEFPLFNYANTLRKLQEYPAALHTYMRCASLRPHHHSINAAIGFTFHLMGRFQEAIEYYHKALGCKPNDSFSLQMLDRALVDIVGRSTNSSSVGPLPTESATGRQLLGSPVANETAALSPQPPLTLQPLPYAGSTSEGLDFSPSLSLASMSPMFPPTGSHEQGSSLALSPILPAIPVPLGFGTLSPTPSALLQQQLQQQQQLLQQGTPHNPAQAVNYLRRPARDRISAISSISSASSSAIEEHELTLGMLGALDVEMHDASSGGGIPSSSTGPVSTSSSSSGGGNPGAPLGMDWLGWLRRST